MDKTRASLPDYVIKTISLNGKTVPVIAAGLSAGDRIGSILARLGINRMRYRVQPGLYAIGKPGADSPVLVTANYKLTFDSLRKELTGIDAWILVLDTKGINVWCAAGKGTFGTKELVSRIISTELFNVVKHRNIIVPQLGAVGVSAHQVASFTKFKVVYGPVRAADIPEFLKNGMNKTDEMRRVKFNLKDRAVLVPVELMMSWPAFLAVAGVFLALDLISMKEISPIWVVRSLAEAIPVFGAVLAGCVFVPLLLPFIPFRAFSLKGAVLGALFFIPSAIFYHYSIVDGTAVFLWMTSLSAFFAMNFTGSSTYTSLSGAEQEVRTGTPVMIGAVLTGLVLKTLVAFNILS